MTTVTVSLTNDQCRVLTPLVAIEIADQVARGRAMSLAYVEDLLTVYRVLRVVPPSVTPTNPDEVTPTELQTFSTALVRLLETRHVDYYTSRPPAESLSRMATFLKVGNRIDAIKDVRNTTGLPLKEAKTLMEDMAFRMRWEKSYPYTTREQA